MSDVNVISKQGGTFNQCPRLNDAIFPDDDWSAHKLDAGHDDGPTTYLQRLAGAGIDEIVQKFQSVPNSVDRVEYALKAKAV